MSVSSKCYYALRAVYALADHPGTEPLKIAEIAAREQIPIRFLEVILGQLKGGGFVQSRRGVEAFLEPKTTVTEVTVMLIAHDGEWTRRRVPSVEAARAWGNRIGIPVYDIALVGYPKRKREYDQGLVDQALDQACNKYCPVDATLTHGTSISHVHRAVVA